MSLRVRILLLVLLATITPGVVLGVYFFNERNRDIEEAKHNLGALAKHAAETLEDKIKGTVQLLHGLSRAADLDTSDQASCSAFLAGVLARFPQYTGLLTITPNGDLHCDSLRSGRKLNVSARDYFIQARTSLEPAFDVVIGGLTGIAVLQVAYPVLDGQGALKYVLLASLNLSEYAQELAAASQYSNLRMLIWNRKGMLMVRKPDVAGDTSIGRTFAESELFRFATSGRTGTAAELPGLEGEARVWALSVLSEPRGGGARITLGILRNSLKAEANKNLRNALLVLIGVSLVAFVSAWYVAEIGIRRPVLRITRATGRVGAGDLGARIGAPYPQGELGELMAVVDGTVGAVQAQQSEIELNSRDLQRLNRTLRMLSGVNALIVRVRDRDELFKEACRIAVDRGEFPMAWVGLLDPVTLDVTTVAWAGADAESLARMKATARSDHPEGSGVMGRAVRTKKPVVDNDIAAGDRFMGPRRLESLKRGYRSLIALPLMMDGEVVGNLSVYAMEPNFYNEDELNLLSELADNISFALQNISRQQRLDKLSRTRAVSSGIRSTLVRVRNRQELFREACRIAVEDGHFPFAWIGALDPETQNVPAVAWAGEGAEALTRAVSSAREDAPRGKGAVGQAIRERRLVYNNDVAARAFGGPRLQEILKLGFRSQITLPLFEGEAVVGTLTMYAREPDFFDEEEIRLMTELAGDISFALESISRQQKLEKLARMRAVSSEINAAIIRVHGREALLLETCRIAVEHGKFELVWNALVDQDKESIEPIAWAGFSSETAHSITWASRGAAGFIAEIIRTRKVAMRADDGGSPAALRQDALKRGYRSSACVPFVVGDRVVAAMTLFAPEPGFFDAEEIALLNEVAGNISFALEHIEKEEKIARLSRIRAVTGSINALIVRVRDRQELFDEACRIAVEQGNFGMAWIGMLDPVTQDVAAVAWAGDNAELISRPKRSARDDTPAGQGSIGRAIREQRPIFNNDIAAHSLAGPHLKETLRLGFRSLIGLPLFEGGAVVGTLALYASEPDFFDEEEVRLLGELTGDISFALENLSRQQKVDKLARTRAVSSEINAAIVRVHDREALLQQTCRIAVEHGKFEFAWIGLVDQEKQHIQSVDWAGFSTEIAHRVRWAGVSTSGTLAEVIRTRKVAIRNDTGKEMPVGTLRLEAARRGYRSSVCVPFMVNDSVVATLMLFAAGQVFFDDEEVALLSDVAGNISFALQAIKKNEQLNYLAYYDALTGLANRSLFIERVAQHIRSAVGGGYKLALFLIDLERFKNINDTLGQPAGDTLLRLVAEWLTRNTRDVNLVARIGADHFAVVLPEIRQAGSVTRLLEKMTAAFLDHPFPLNDSIFRIAAKVGIACFPDDGTDADTLFRNAEAALKKAKASGERYLFYTQKMTEMVATKLTLENQLRQALDNEEFVLHYQPKVNLGTGKVTSAEALIRWNDPRRGLVPPAQFIPVLEETGLINAVGRWALRKAIEDYLRWRNAGFAAVRIAVNVSPLQLRNRGFIAEVRQALSIDGDAAAGLELEITESLIMEDVKHSIATLQALRELGIRMAIDDFGTGFSSLSYLSKLPVDTLKIDRSFVVDMTAGPQGLALVSTIIKLAHSLKLKVVAEGVETEEQSRLLRLLGCDEMQGYLFCKPMPRDIFETRFLAMPLTA